MNRNIDNQSLSRPDFLEIVKNTKLISIDIILRNPHGEILMGKRINSPAKHKWFVPGGRIRKRELIKESLSRIIEDELELDLSGYQGILTGSYDHIYLSDNFADVPGIDTEYVVIGYYVDIDFGSVSLESLPKNQHSDWAWIKEGEGDLNIHENSYAYFKLARHILCDDRVYENLNRRRDSFNQLLWSAPSISLVAQSFLFSVILNNDTGTVARIISAVLAASISVVSIQLLAKHRFNEREIAIELDKIEQHSNRYRANRILAPKTWLEKQSSYWWWTVMLWLFGITAIAIIFIMLISPETISR